MEHCRNEFQNGRYEPRELNAGVMLTRYKHWMDRLRVADVADPALMQALRREWFNYGR